MANSQSNYNILLKKLDEFTRKYYLNQMVKGLIWFAALGVALFLIVSTLEYLARFNSLSRTILFYGSICFLAALFIQSIALPFAKMLALGKRISHAQAAAIIGKHFTEIDDKLLNVLQLKKQANQSQSNLLEASINQKIQDLRPIPFSLAIRISENKKYLKYALPPIFILALMIAFSPQVISESTNRLVAHNQEFESLAPYDIEIENEELKGFKNEDYKLKIKVTGEQLPKQLKVKFEEQSYLMRKIDLNHFQFVFKNLANSKSFLFTDDEFNSATYFIEVLPKPSTLAFEIELDYPTYLGKKDEVKTDQGDLSLPQGTEVKWRFKTTDTDELNFFWKDSAYSCLPSAQDQFVFELRAMQSGVYGFSNSNEYLKKADTFNYKLSVVPDLRPSIEVDARQDSSSPKLLFFKGFVKDDYGFSRLEFHAFKNNSKGGQEIHIKKDIPINKNIPQNDFYHSFNLDTFNLSSEEEVSYYFEVWDNDGVNGSKSARTPSMTYKAPSQKELKREEEKSNQEVKKKLEENIKLSQEIKKDLEAIKQKMLNKKKLGYQEKKQLESLLEKQKKLRENLNQIENKNKQKNQFQNEFNPMDEALMEKQKKLQELFEQVMSEEMKEMMEEMEKMMEQMKEKELQEQIEQMELSNEDIEKELDRNLELFKQLEVEKKLHDAQKKLDEIKKEQADLKQKTNEKSEKPEELQKKQEELKEDFEELSKELEDLKKKNDALEEPFEMDDTKSLEESIKQDMKESAESLSKKQESKSSEKQEEAEEGMEELSEKLSDMQMDMQMESQAENLEDMRALLENLIHLSFDQEEVMEELKDTDPNDPRYVDLAQTQNKLQDDSKVIEDSLFALSKRVIQLASTINKEMGEVKHNMEKAVEQLGERNTPVARSRQQLAMTSINNLALLFDDAIQQMQSMMQSQMKSNGQCNKPGQKPGGKPSVGGLKKMQQQLQKQMEGLKKAMEQGKKPGQKPGSGQAGMSKQLAQMAAKQAAIRKAIEEMQEQIGEGQEGGGNLKKIGDLMEKNETDLVNKQITNETILRQQEILSRLLQSEKAERQREMSPKRESNEFTDEISRNPNSFFEYNMQKEKEIELLKTMPPSFNPFFKSKVTQYFNQLQP